MRARLRRFAASKLADELTASYSPVRQRLKMGLILLAVTCLGVSLARPQYGVVLEESEARGIDLMIALDTSRSMLAEDVKPNRLDRAKLAVLDLVNAMRGDRVGLVAFAGDAFLQCPLTLDYDAFRSTLDATDTRVIPRGGTNLAAAIEEAEKALGDDRNFKLLVLLTDGEDLEASGIAAARKAAANGLRIFTVGVGGASGEPIPIRDERGNPTLLRDASGRIVRSALDEETLKEIAAASNGFYAPLGAGGGGLQAVYQQLIDELPAEELGTRMQEIPLERYQWPLAAGLLFLFLEPLLGTRRRQARRPDPGKGLGTVTPAEATSRRALASSFRMLPLFLLLGLPAFPTPAPASPVEAVALYEDGKYEESAALLEEALKASPDDARLHYNLGNAYYRLERWDDARHAFDRALRTKDPLLQADAFFNLGNTLYQIGQHTPDTPEGREDRLALWQKALENYQNSAALQAKSDDLEQNEKLVQRALAVLARRLDVSIDPLGAGEAGPSGLFVAGSLVEVTAEANPGWFFRAWKDAPVENPGSAKTQLTLNEDTHAIATFVKTWHLEVLSDDPEHGTAEKTGDFPEDQPATVTAQPKDPWVFHHWEAEGAEISPADQAQAQVTLTQDAKVTAFFAPGFLLEVVPEPAIGGYVGDSGYFEQFTQVPIHAKAREGFEWSGWVGEDLADSQALETTVELNRDHRVSAHFRRLWSLIVAENDPQGGTVTGSGDFPIGTRTPIKATPNEGYKFVEWIGEGVADPTAAETEVTVQSMKHDVIAKFEPEESDDQNQDDQNQDQQNQDQQNQDQQNQDNQKQDSSSDDSQSQEQEQDEQEQEQDESQQSEEEQEPPEEEKPQPSEGEESEDKDEQTEQAQPAEPRSMDEMTAEEARQLLNALRESEKKLPAVRRVRPGDDTTGRDW